MDNSPGAVDEEGWRVATAVWQVQARVQRVH